MFTDLKNKLDSFHDLDHETKQSLLKEIHTRAVCQKEMFQNYLLNVNYGTLSHRDIFYEAIWNYPQGWEDFFHTELSQLITKAENGNKDAIDSLSAMIYLTYLEDMNTEFYTKSVDFLTQKLRSKIPEVRENCAQAITDIHAEYEVELSYKQISELQKLLKDSAFKVRVNAYANLKDANLVPKKFSISLIDKIRARLFGYSSLLK
ncbi:hypothetical protein OAU89_01590 [bacterium]|jgi:hypothetical protein|nr:hypothetical protein [Saprospiraceae bacterium]MDC3253569.1 hypothetical protein [bacterium]MDG1434709.1 hypothetical protein [Saprospiraceae bacterium]